MLSIAWFNLYYVKVQLECRAIIDKNTMQYNCLYPIVPPAINTITHKSDVISCLEEMLQIFYVATIGLPCYYYLILTQVGIQVLIVQDTFNRFQDDIKN